MSSDIQHRDGRSNLDTITNFEFGFGGITRIRKEIIS
jgi:hypothetical protein